MSLYLPPVWMGSQVSTKLLPSSIRPLSARLELTENRQAKCISCDYWKTRWKDAIDTDRAIDLNRIDELGIHTLRLTGGRATAQERSLPFNRLRADISILSPSGPASSVFIEGCGSSPVPKVSLRSKSILSRKNNFWGGQCVPPAATRSAWITRFTLADPSL